MKIDRVGAELANLWQIFVEKKTGKSWHSVIAFQIHCFITLQVLWVVSRDQPKQFLNTDKTVLYNRKDKPALC